MKILLAQKYDRDPSAGHAGKRLLLAENLSRLGVEVDTFFGDDPPVGVRRLRLRTFPWRLPARVRRGRYDLVDATSGTSWLLGILPRRFALVESVYGAEHMYYYRWKKEVGKGGYRTIVPRFRIWYPWLQLPLVARAWRNADHLVCEASDNRDFLAREGLAPLAKVSVVGSGVDDTLLAVKRSAGPTRRFLFVSGWMLMKGVRYLAQAFEALARRVPDTTLTILGGHTPGDDPRGYFTENARRRIEVLSRVQRNQMPAIYARHDALVFPSLSEGFGNVVLEAMAAGMPVISTPVGCACDLIAEGRNGILVPPADSAALAHAMKALAADQELGCRLGRSAKETARTRSWDVEAHKLLQVYEKLLVERGMPAGGARS